MIIIYQWHFDGVKKKGEEVKKITLRIPEELDKKLSEKAEELEISKNSVINILIKKKIETLKIK